jgi:hypothetical protein
MPGFAKHTTVKAIILMLEALKYPLSQCFMLGPRAYYRHVRLTGAELQTSLRFDSQHHSPHHGAPALQNMRWPWSGDGNEKGTKSEAWIDNFRSTDWLATFTDSRTIGPSIILTASTVAALRFYKSYLRRIPSVNHIKPEYFRRRSLFGKVTSVGDADNFRLFHTPGGRIAGWGWIPWKRVPTKKDGLAKNTVRLLGTSSPTSLIVTLDPHTDCWRRRSRTGALGARSTAIFQGGMGMAQSIYP